MDPSMASSLTEKDLRRNNQMKKDEEEREEKIQLRIRVAVLENELKLKVQQQTNTNKALVAVVQALNYISLSDTPPLDSVDGRAQIHSYGGVDYDHSGAKMVQDLKKEIDSLRGEIGIMRGEINGLRLENRGLPIQMLEGIENNKDLNSNLQEANSEIEGSAASIQRHQDTDQQLLVQNRTSGSLNPTNSFQINTSTPGSPILAANHSAGIANVGIKTLDDVLGPEGEYMPSLPANPSIHSEIDIKDTFTDNEISMPKFETQEEHERTISIFKNMPAPRVLQTGFQTKGSFQGDNYNLRPRNINSDKSHRFGPRGNEQRFAESQADLSSVWDSNEERLNALENHRQQTGRFGSRFPDFFRYGITFIPAKSDSGFLRTVHIGNLPKGVNLREVLARVRGGQILSSVLTDTTAITGGMSALVQFVYSEAAQEYASYTSNVPLFFGEDKEKVQAEVTLINTPTYPLTNSKKNIIFNLHQTRCIRILNFPISGSLSHLEHYLMGQQVRLSNIVDIYFDEERNVHIEFSSIEMAGRTLAMLKPSREYNSLQLQFEDDPCARPVEELMLEPKNRLSLFPQGGFLEGISMRGLSVGEKASEGTEGLGSGLLQFEPMHTQHRSLAALTAQKAKIPSFTSNNLLSFSWADEMNDELESPIIPSALNMTSSGSVSANDNGQLDRATSATGAVSAVLANSVGGKMRDPDAQWMKGKKGVFRKPPVSLARSKYASHIPGFRDRRGTQQVGRIVRKTIEGQAVSGGQGDDGAEIDKANGLEVKKSSKDAVSGDTRGESKVDTGSQVRSSEQVIKGELQLSGMAV